MDIEECLKYYLDASTGIHDIIADRIYPDALPQNPTLPALTYELISGLEHHNIDVAYPYYQLSGWATTRAGVKTLGDEVVSAFKRMKDIMGGTSGKRVIQAVIENRLTFYQPETLCWQGPIDIKIVYVK